MDRVIVFKNKPIAGLVSIVIPAFNRDHLIGSTLASIREQTYKNWEVVVVEDSSRGKTQQIVKSFGQSVDNRVLYRRNQQNLGAAETRNVAFAEASGQYIAFLDSDDRWLPNHLSSLVETLERTRCDIAYANVQMVEDQTDGHLGMYGPSSKEVATFPESLFLRNFVVPSATVIRRNVLSCVGGWSSDCRYCEDFDFWLRCVRQNFRFEHLCEETCLYRKCHAGATTEKLAATIEEVAFIVRRYVNEEGRNGRLFRQAAYQNLIAASRLHRRSDPTKDPSSDGYRGGQLLLEAWRLKRSKIGLLAKGLGVCAHQFIRQSVAKQTNDRSKYRTPIAGMCQQSPANDFRFKKAA